MARTAQLDAGNSTLNSRVFSVLFVPPPPLFSGKLVGKAGYYSTLDDEDDRAFPCVFRCGESDNVGVVRFGHYRDFTPSQRRCEGYAPSVAVVFEYPAGVAGFGETVPLGEVVGLADGRFERFEVRRVAYDLGRVNIWFFGATTRMAAC
jgi:hypothetical protein